MRTARGFTLMEVLIAIAIFGIVGLGANQMLRTVMTTHERAREVTDAFAGYTRAFMLLERDVSQIVPRGISDEFGDPAPPLTVNSSHYQLEFTRTGWNNPLQLPRSNLQRVAYGVDADGALVRHIWMVLDRAEDSAPIRQELLADVADFRVSALMADGTRTDVWPEIDSTAKLPVSLELVVETRSMGELRKVVPLVSELRDPLRGRPGSGQPGGPDVEGVENDEELLL